MSAVRADDANTKPKAPRRGAAARKRADRVSTPGSENAASEGSQKPPVKRGSGNGGKADHCLQVDRVDLVQRLIGRCTPHALIASHVAEKYGVTVDQGYRYIQAVYKRCAADPHESGDDSRRRMLMRLESHYDLCVTKGDYVEAGRTLDRFARVDGLYVDMQVKVKHSGQVALPINITVDDARRELYARMAARALPAA